MTLLYVIPVKFTLLINVLTLLYCLFVYWGLRARRLQRSLCAAPPTSINLKIDLILDCFPTVAELN